MFEGLVKRMLDTYLAPYVDGITQNLQMAVWSGNISLENLTLKDDITSRLALPFHAVSGRVGSINIRIPWASLGTTPIKIVIDSVYICIDNRSNVKTDAEILAHLRKKKNNLISLLEHEYFELANLQSEGKLSSSYIIKLSQKILNNIQIDFTNIHLQFFDEHSSFAFKIDSIFIRKSRGDETKKSLRLKTNDEYREEPVTHVCSLLGFSIYETNFKIPKNQISSKGILEIIINQNDLNGTDSNDYIGLLMLEPLSFRLYLAINARNKSIYASLCIGSIMTSKTKLSKKVINYTNYIKSNITNLTNKNTYRDSKEDTNKDNNSGDNEYQDVNKDDDDADEDRLRIMLTSDVIKTFTKMWVDINMDRKRGKRILMAKSNEVKLDHDSLKTSTKAEFIKLYTKYKLSNTESNNVNKDMDSEELDRLQDLIDLVPARYIARWKFACKQRSSVQVVTKENKSWFKWAKNIVTTTYTNYQSSKSNANSGNKDNNNTDNKEPKKSFRPSFFSLNLNSSFGSNKENKDSKEDNNKDNINNTQTKLQENEFGVDKEDKSNISQSEVKFEPDVTKDDELNKYKVVLENLPGGLVLTEDEVKMIQETISLEELFEDSFTTSSYYFECVLPSFQFMIHLLNPAGVKVVNKDEENIILIDIQNLQSRLFMHALMDMKDRDRYEGYFDLNLDSFDVILKDKKIMTFSQQNLPFQSIVDTYIDPFHQEGFNEDVKTCSELFNMQKPLTPGRLEMLESISVAEKCIMNLRVYHKITEKGNIIMVNGELRPIETNIFPELISVFFELISLFKPIKNIIHEDLGLEGYTYNSSSSKLSIGSDTNNDNINNTQTKNYSSKKNDKEYHDVEGTTRNIELDEDELLSNVQMQFDTTREVYHMGSKDMDKIHFVNFDIKFSAPILILYHDNNRIDFYFGTLHIKSNGDCPVGHIEGTLELKQTQITCNYMDKSFNFLRPLPVKIHYDLDLKNEQINLNVIFEEVFAQLEPLATSILFKIPNEIVKIITKNMMQDNSQYTNTYSEENLEVVGYNSNLVNNKLKNFKICSNVLIRHSGFSVSNLNLHEIFKLDMYNVSIKMSNSLKKSNFNLSLESIIISNPTTKIPLFKTINSKNVDVGYENHYEQTNYNDPEVNIDDLNIMQYSNNDELKYSTAFNTREFGNTKEFGRSDSNKDHYEFEDEYLDAIEDVSKSLDLEILTNIDEENNLINAVSVYIIEMEGNWEYSTIKLVVDGFQEYSNIFNNHMNSSTFTTITTTFKTFKEKFIFPNTTNLLSQTTPTNRDEVFNNHVDAKDTVDNKDNNTVNKDKNKDDDNELGINNTQNYNTNTTSKEYSKKISKKIEGFLIRNELPILDNEVNSGIKLITRYNMVIKGASVVFNNSSGDIIAKLCVGKIIHHMSIYKNNEKVIKLSIQTGKLYFGGRCILSHLTCDSKNNTDKENMNSSKNNKECINNDNIVNRNGNETDRSVVDNNLLDLNLKCYNNPDVPYSICFQGKVDRVVFVYFQHDINRFFEYFDDGILSVFLSKSYHKVVERADQIYFFYHFSVTSPIFILPENKAAIPNCESHYKQIIPPGSTLPLYNHNGNNNTDTSNTCRKDTKEDNTNNDSINTSQTKLQENDTIKNKKHEKQKGILDKEGKDKQLSDISSVVDLWYFGSYILFELGHLEFRNTYSKLLENYKSTIILKMLGTKAQIIEQKNGSLNVGGLFLDPTDLNVCTRGRDLMEIGVDSKALVMKLTRNQLTFLIDVFNENIGGASYKLKEAETNSFTQNFPTKNESRYLMRLSLNKMQFYCYNNLNRDSKEDNNKDNNTREYNNKNRENRYYRKREDDIIPVGMFEFNDITCCLDYASNNVQLLSYYQFGFISKSLKITDLRLNGFNKYKTLLKCNNTNDTSHENLLTFDEEHESDEIHKRINGLLFEWLKSYKNRTGNDFFKINPNNFMNKNDGSDTNNDNINNTQTKNYSSKKNDKEYISRKDTKEDNRDRESEDGIKCVIVSDPEESLIDVIVSNSEIPLLFVFFFDLVRFFNLSYGTSSMSLFPKISQVNVERVYMLNCLVSKSKFISFSKMDMLDCPRLELVTDFVLQMQIHGNSFKFTKLDIIDCLLSRVYPNTNINQVLCGNFLMYGKGHYLSDVSSKMFFQFTIPQINLLLYTRDLSIIIYCFKSMFTDGPSVLPVKLVNNQLIDDNSSKFLTLSFDIKGIEMLFFDDLKKSIIPLVKFTVESEKLEILNLPIEKRYSLMRCNCHLYYFNTNVGDWEPFIEKFIFNLEYITSPSGNNSMNQMNKRISNQINANKSTRTSEDSEWKDFVSEYQIKITCNNNLLVNITPNLCQLLQYFLPILKSNLLQSPYRNNPNNLYSANSLSDKQGNTTGKEGDEDDIEMYNYRYINLTNYEYYGFIMDLYKNRKDAFSDVLNIVTTTNPKQLDSLVNQLHKEVSSNEYCIYLITKPPKHILKQLAKELNCSEQLIENDLLTTSSILRTKSNLSNIKHVNTNTMLSKEFNKNVLFNNGIVLSNIPLSKNCTVLLSIPVKDLNLYNEVSKENSKFVDNNKFSENGSQNEMDNNEDNCDELTNMLSISTNTDARSIDNSTAGSLSQGTDRNISTNRLSNTSGSQLGGSSNFGNFTGQNLVTNRTSNMSTNNIGISQNNRVTNINKKIVNNNIICQVLSPHPSHKLLLFTSTVRIYNKSGLPIVMCFLDYNFNQQYMYSLNQRTIPCNLLNQNDMQNFKQYTSNTLLSNLSEVFKGNVDFYRGEPEGHCIVIPNDYMLSVPENVFLSESQVIFSFKPLYTSKDLEQSLQSFESINKNYGSSTRAVRIEFNKLVNRSGWCKIIDSTHHVGTRVRQCYCPDLSKNGFLYFVVSVNNKRSSLPANVNISEIVIYPSISVMNALPIDLDIRLLSKDYNLASTKSVNREMSERKIEREDYMFKLYNKSILHIYSVPPNESLSLFIRLSAENKGLGGVSRYSDKRSNSSGSLTGLDEQKQSSEWCNRIDNIYGNNDSKSVFSIMVNNNLLELELIRFPGALPVNNLCIQGHLSLIINAAWLFIDRTGLKLVPQHFNRIYTTNNLSFLYDNNNNNYKLISLNNPNQTSRLSHGDRHQNRHSSSSTRHSSSNYRLEEYVDENEYDIKMPIIGGYVYTSIDIKGKKHNVCLITEKVYIPGLSHISSKITSALPEYLFTNNLNDVVYLRKDTRTQCLQISPSTTESISHLTRANILTSPSNAARESDMNENYKDNYIEIKVGMETCWSNVIYLSEIYSGETFMSLPKENSSKSKVYNITIIPKNGIKYISINPSLAPTANDLNSLEKTNDVRGYLLYNNCSLIKVVMIRTFHKSDFKNGSCFTAKYGQVIHFGWPNPFVHKSKLVQVLLWLDKNTVAPSKPLIFNFSTPSFRFRRIELTTPEYHTNYNITILAENRIDYFVIIINPNDGNTNPSSVVPAVGSTNFSSSTLSRNRDTEKVEPDEIDDNVLMKNTDKNMSDFKNEDLYVFDDENSIKSYQVILNISQIGISIVSQSLHEELFFLEMSGIMALFMCKEDHQRLELKITDVQLDNQTDLDMGKTILVNRSKMESSDASFLQVYIDRPFSNCKDISIKKMFVSLDDLQVDINDLLFTKVYSYYKECLLSILSSTLNSEFGRTNYGSSYNSVENKVPRKIDIEMIEKWVDMENKRGTSSIDVNVKLPRSISIDYLYVEAFTLVVWCCFELDKLHMLGDLLRMGLRILSVSRNFELMGAPLSFQREYVSISRTSVFSFYEQLKEKYLQSCLSCIGSILGYSNLLNIPKLPLTVGRCTIELAADAVDSVSSGLGLVLSKFTFDKEYMKRRSTAKEVTGIKDGLFSAGKTIGEGLFSLTNIVTKPIEGAQKEGVGGFIKGLGKGLVGSIVKPIDKMGIAVSQVSRGIKANISKEEKVVIGPCRNPRMLWGEFAQIRPFSAEDAEIKQVLGPRYAKHIMDCLLVMKQQSGSGGKHVALLFYPSRIYLVDLKPSSPNLAKKPYTIWKLQITNITDVRASSHGVIIKCGLEQYQVPCTRADMINSIHNCFQRAIKHASSQITIGPELFNNA